MTRKSNAEKTPLPDDRPPLKVVPSPQPNEVFIWNDDDPPAINYAALGKRLAASDDLFRNPAYANGLILLLPGGKSKPVTKGADLAPIIVDRVRVTVERDGKSKGGMIPSAHLGAMLLAETFLSEFPPVDLITTVPMYLADFALTTPGYNDGGEGHRILFVGGKPQVSDSMEKINASWT